VTAYNDNPRCVGDYVVISADSTADRRSRAAEIGKEVGKYKRQHGVALELAGKWYDEKQGFLYRSEFRYRIVR
jgi:hypothetical protein